MPAAAFAATTDVPASATTAASATAPTTAPAPAGSMMQRMAERTGPAVNANAATVFALDRLEVFYGSFRAVRDVTLNIHANEITAFIGPSGCGKSTVLRCLNRMNDLIAGSRVRGHVTYHGIDLYGPDVSATEVRRVSMVFQKPNPFPKSIYDNVAFGPRISGIRDRAKLDEIVEKSLRGAALWDEVKDRLQHSALGMSGGQQQRLCIYAHHCD